MLVKVKIIRERDLYKALRENDSASKNSKDAAAPKRTAASKAAKTSNAAAAYTIESGTCSENADVQKAAAQKPKPDNREAAKKTASDLAKANALAKQKERDARFLALTEKHEKLVKSFQKKAETNFEAKRRTFQTEMDSLTSEKANLEQELGKTGFFQFSRKAELRQKITNLCMRMRKIQGELEEHLKNKETILKNAIVEFENSKENANLKKEFRKAALEECDAIEDAEIRELGRQIIGNCLSEEPMTANDINQKMGTNYSALKIVKALRHNHYVATTKVQRPKTGSGWLEVTALYTAYYLK